MTEHVKKKYLVSSIKALSINSIKEHLKYLGVYTRSNNKSYLLKKYLDKEKKLIVCQAYIKGWLKRREYQTLRDVHAQDINKLPLILNSHTLLGTDFNDICQEEFFIIKDGNQYYGFHLPQIWEWICNCGNNTNPYTNNTLSDFVIKQIERLYRKHQKNSITNIAQDNVQLNLEESFNARLTNFFLKIESMGCYANMEGYKNLTKEQLWNFFKTLRDEYESIRKIISEEDVNSLSKLALVEELHFRTGVLAILEKIIDDKFSRAEKEGHALIFTLHLSKCLSPNNDELEHYYLHNLNFLIQSIIQHNTFTDTSHNSNNNNSNDSIKGSTDNSIDDSNNDNEADINDLNMVEIDIDGLALSEEDSA